MSAAWEQDADWGTFVITGARRGELLGLAWEHLDLPAGLLTIRRNLVRQNAKTVIKDTKTHQMRIVSLDPDTIAILRDHQQRVEQRCTAIGTILIDDAFVFSYAPDHRRHCDPDGITHRYPRMTADLGLDTHLHALRHYSATELIAAGVDVRTVAERLGHGGLGRPRWQIDADLAQFQELGIHAVRFLILGNGLTYGLNAEVPELTPAVEAPREQSNAGRWRFRPVQLPSLVVEHFVQLVQAFAQTRVKLMPVFLGLDFSMYPCSHTFQPGETYDPSHFRDRNGIGDRFVAGRRGAALSRALRMPTGETHQEYFIEHALGPLLDEFRPGGRLAGHQQVIHSWDIPRRTRTRGDPPRGPMELRYGGARRHRRRHESVLDRGGRSGTHCRVPGHHRV